MNRPSLLPIILTILLNSSIYCQDKDWWAFELDGIGVDFPFEEVSQKDTTILGIKIKMLYTKYDNKALIFQKQLVGKNISEFPHNYEALRKYYDEVVDGMQNRFESEVIKKEINIRGFIGTNATFVRDSVPFSESNIFLIH